MARFYWRHLLRRTREIAHFVQISSDPLKPGNARGMSPKHLAAAPLLAQLSQRGQRVPALPLLGTASRVSEILSGKRDLSIAMVRRLSARFAIPADLLIRQGRSRKRLAA